MKFYDLAPTNENVYQTFLDDKIGRNSKVFKFISLINRIETSCSISLDSSWGSGKTIFVKQVKMVLDSLNSFKKKSDFTEEQEDSIKNKFSQLVDKYISVESIKPHVCVYYDAWENDSDTDPLISLAYKIAKDFSCEYVFENAPKVQEIVSSSLKTIVSRITNIDVNRIYDDCHFTNKLEEIEKTKSLEQTISEMFDSLLPEHGDRLIVFIDELDRCKPTYAVKLLERIKHYFTNPKITFVFSTNLQELGNTIKKMYGSDFDADRYFDKFFDLRLSLPQIDIEQYLNNLGYLSHELKTNVLVKIFKKYSFSMREICRFLKIYELTKINDRAWMNSSNSENSKYCFNILQCYILPLFLVLHMTNSKELTSFINGKNPKPFVDLIDNINWPLLDRLNISSMPIYESKREDCLREVLSLLYEKIFNPNFHCDSALYGNSFNVIEFNSQSLKIIIESFSLISEFNENIES